ncbi:hypothetical protein [Nocardiopsis synnemataformans]|uniref:hypothetical protein n=1 Tax=Nocardiopsis synnemataformans TaxID=61305 RepID=UPI003EBCC31E
MSSAPRRFRLVRDVDHTGVSGTGHVADGVVWPDGTATVRWRGTRASTVNWDRVEDAEAIHGHGGATRIQWVDPDSAAYDDTCPHCPDGHRRPDSKPWGAYLSHGRDSDGQPLDIIVGRPAGEHVSEADVHWVWQTLNGRAT